MERRSFTKEFKLEAVKLIRDRGVAVKQRALDLGVPVDAHAAAS
jgi:transposase